MDTFRCGSIRLSRYLYSLGFNKESIIVNGQENWLFEKNPDLQEALDFFFYFRKKINKGVNENADNTKGKNLDDRRR